jgi:hypothetical protein
VIRDGVPPERRFAVQRAVGRAWRTLAVDRTGPGAAQRFAACVRAEPRAVFRLIEAEARDGSGFDEFDWRLLEIHDPRRFGLVPDLSEPGAAPPRPLAERRRAPAPARPPVRLYLAMLLAGAALGAAAWWVLAWSGKPPGTG